MEYTIDATNKSLGRLASEAATILMGKNSASFARNVISTNRVTITNASKLKVSPKKLDEKTYSSYSGYPGGLKESKMAHVVTMKGYKDVVERAIKGMLPDNKLKKEMLKHLVVTE
jgi:large subunit ribosomal protein L13